MIDFIREGKNIKIKVTSSIGWNFTFVREFEEEPYAILLSQKFHEDLNNKLREIRRTAYEQGWKDAKAKAKKEDWFSGWW